MSGCATTQDSYVALNTSPRQLAVRSPEQVGLFASSAPERPHVDVGLIIIERADPRTTPEELLGALRAMAAQRGCDAVVIGSTSSRSCSGTCVVYRDAPVAAATSN
jgi:hypothetical protein